MRRRAVLYQLLFLVGFLGLWEGLSRSGLVDPESLPAFTDVAVALWSLLGNGEFLGHAGDTLLRVIVAFAIGAPLAISIGFILGEKLHLGEIINPIVHFLLAVPQSIFLPIFILLFGIGFMEKIVFGVTHIVFVVIVNTVAAVASVPRSQILAARSFGATPTQIYMRVYFPAMLPLLVTGLRLGMIFNIIGILLAEMYASRTGVGQLIFQWGEDYRVTELMAGIVLVSVATIAINELMRFWEARAGHWMATEQAA
ncbi:MAG: ABC transporter permease [Proteobacteria bacterium]|nr:ABC transporter permease [Pseudomonadota bacterium]